MILEIKRGNFKTVYIHIYRETLNIKKISANLYKFFKMNLKS